MQNFRKELGTCTRTKKWLEDGDLWGEESRNNKNILKFYFVNYKMKRWESKVDLLRLQTAHTQNASYMWTGEELALVTQEFFFSWPLSTVWLSVPGPWRDCAENSICSEGRPRSCKLKEWKRTNERVSMVAAARPSEGMCCIKRHNEATGPVAWSRGSGAQPDAASDWVVFQIYSQHFDLILGAFSWLSLVCPFSWHVHFSRKVHKCKMKSIYIMYFSCLAPNPLP